MKVSIITVTYNSEKTLRQTLDSVLRQTYPDIEYWIIDGHSRDHTLDIVKEYEPRFGGRMHWISESDIGVYDAMNKGVTRSTGDVVGILNSDDFFTSDDVIERMVSSFPRTADAVYGDVHFVSGDNVGKCVRYYSGRIFRPSLVKYGFIAPHPSFYIRREVFDRYGLYDPSYKISGDFELVARFCYKYRIRTRYLHIDFVTMRTGGVSTRSWQMRWLGARESAVACRRLGIKSGMGRIVVKYAIKIYESLFIRN